jgi:Protein of unknown function (DUF2934)
MDSRPDSMLEHRIQQRAYEIHQTNATGSPLEDWLEAERQVLREVGRWRDGLSRRTADEGKRTR